MLNFLGISSNEMANNFPLESEFRENGSFRIHLVPLVQLQADKAFSS